MKAFCLGCGEIKEVIVKSEIITEVFEGVEVSYPAQVAYCPECGEMLYVGELHDTNLKQLYNAFRERMNIISLEDIIKLKNKYEISVRNLSKILDFGEHAIENFLEGYIPSQSCSDTMKAVLKSEDLFIKKLNCNKHRISEKAYKQALKGLKKSVYSYENDIISTFSTAYVSYIQEYSLLSA